MNSSRLRWDEYLRNLVLISVLHYRGLFISWQGSGYIARAFVSPLLVVFFVSLFGKFASDPTAAQGYAIGMAVFSMPFVIAGGLFESAYVDRRSGTLSMVLVSRAHRVLLYLTRSAVHWINGLVTMAACLFCGWVLIGLDFTEVNLLGAACSVVALLVSSVAFALLMSNFTTLLYNMTYVYQVLYSICWLLTGVVIPVANLPPGLREISSFIPITHGFSAFRQSFSGAGLEVVGGEVLLEIVIGLCYAVAGFLVFRYVETMARRRGFTEEAEAV